MALALALLKLPACWGPSVQAALTSTSSPSLDRLALRLVTGTPQLHG